MRAVCLVLTIAFLAAGVMLFARSLRRDRSLHGLAGMATMMTAGVPAIVYAALTS